MGETSEKNIDDDVEVIQEEETNAPVQKKKRNFKLHFFLILVLGAGTWAFWTYSPLAQQLKIEWLPSFNQEHGIEQAVVTHTSPVSQPIATYYDEPAATAIEPSLKQEPTFEPVPDLNLAVTQSINSDATPSLQVENLDDITSAIQQMQEQVNAMQLSISNMQAHQLQYAQQQVRSQLFNTLRRASSPQASLHDMAIAWKSIGFMPLLDDDKRAFAESAFVAIETLQNDIQNTSNEVTNLINTLAEQLQPQDLAEVAETMTTNIDPYQNADAFYSWLDWLKQQFIFSKIDEHAVTLTDDPYADIKALMSALDTLKQTINTANWDGISNLNTLLYQLEQRGLETSISHQMIKTYKETQQSWQQQAKVWMEQL
ncbi:MAG: hypothetical protein R8M46_06390 [Ghiorsea sp.]